jgi:hypothetical protein
LEGDFVSAPETDPHDRGTARDAARCRHDAAAPGRPQDSAETRIAMLELEVQQLREANEILRNVAGFLASADTSDWH